MKNWTVRQRIVACFGIAIGVFFLVGALAIYDLRAIRTEMTVLENDSVPGLYLTSKLETAVYLDYILAQQLALRDDREGIEATERQLRASRATIDAALHAYERTVHDEQDRALFETTKRTLNDYFAVTDELRKFGAQNNLEAVDNIADRRLPEVFEKIVAALAADLEHTKDDADAAVRAIRRESWQANTVVTAGFVVAILLSLASAGYLVRSVTGPLARLLEVVEVMRQGDFTQRVKVGTKDEFSALGDGVNRMANELTGLVGQVQKSAIQVNASITEVAATAKEQQATANEIAATTTEIGATAREISATSKDLAQSVVHVNEGAQQAATLAENGRDSLSRMDETMRRVSEAAGGINARLTVLNDKAVNIGSVVTTIAKVADQTNLLSLNAAIEAEKAGEYGRGFAVVATEIRRLADQTAAATVDIGELVKEIQSAVTAGVMGMDKFSEEVRRGVSDVEKVSGQLANIIQQVQSGTPRIASMSDGMQAQATGAEQISQALTQLSDATRQTAESLRQTNDTVRSLDEASRGLRSSIERFKVRA